MHQSPKAETLEIFSNFIIPSSPVCPSSCWFLRILLQRFFCISIPLVLNHLIWVDYVCDICFSPKWSSPFPSYLKSYVLSLHFSKLEIIFLLWIPKRYSFHLWLVFTVLDLCTHTYIHVHIEISLGKQVSKFLRIQLAAFSLWYHDTSYYTGLICRMNSMLNWCELNQYFSYSHVQFQVLAKVLRNTKIFFNRLFSLHNLGF